MNEKRMIRHRWNLIPVLALRLSGQPTCFMGEYLRAPQPNKWDMAPKVLLKKP